MRTMLCLPRPRSFCSLASAFWASSSEPPARFSAASARFFVASADARTRSGVFFVLGWALLYSGTTRVYGRPDDAASVAPASQAQRVQSQISHSRRIGRRAALRTEGTSAHLATCSGRRCLGVGSRRLLPPSPGHISWRPLLSMQSRTQVTTENRGVASSPLASPSHGDAETGTLWPACLTSVGDLGPTSDVGRP